MLEITILVANNGFIIKPADTGYTHGVRLDRTEVRVAETADGLAAIVLDWAKKAETERAPPDPK